MTYLLRQFFVLFVVIATGVVSQAQPNLRILSTTVPQDLTVGSYGTYTITIANTGNAVSYSFFGQVSWYSDYSGSDEQLAKFYISSIPANDSIVVTFTLPIPAPVSYNYEALLFEVDYKNNINEGDETDNTYSKAINLTNAQISPNLTVTDITVPDTLNRYENIPISFKETNTGEVVINKRTTYCYLSSNNNFDYENDELIESWDTPILLPGESFTLQNKFITAGIDPSNSNLTLFLVTHFSNGLGVISTKSSPIYANSFQDVVQNKPYIILMDDNDSILVNVINYGNFTNVPSLDSITNNIYFSADSVLDSSDTLMAQTKSSCNQYNINSSNAYLALPTNLSTEHLYIITKSDALNELPENNENNNIYVTPFACDFVAYSIQVRYDNGFQVYNFNPNCKLVDFRFSYYNQGIKKVDSVTVQFDLVSNAPNVVNGNQLIGTFENQIPELGNHTRIFTKKLPLGPNYINYTNFQWELPDTLAFGAYHLEARMDHENLIFEPNSLNNFGKSNDFYYNSTVPDVSVSGMEFKLGSANSDSDTVLVSISNIGASMSIKSNSQRLSVYVNGGILENPVLLYEGYYSLLSPGLTYTKVCLIPKNTLGGGQYMMETKATLSCGEENETNNTFTIPVNIQTALVDLTVTNLQTVQSGSDSINVSFWVKNVGNIVSQSAPVVVSYFNYFEIQNIYANQAYGDNLTNVLNLDSSDLIAPQDSQFYSCVLPIIPLMFTHPYKIMGKVFPIAGSEPIVNYKDVKYDTLNIELPILGFSPKIYTPGIGKKVRRFSNGKYYLEVSTDSTQYIVAADSIGNFIDTLPFMYLSETDGFYNVTLLDSVLISSFDSTGVPIGSFTMPNSPLIIVPLEEGGFVIKSNCFVNCQDLSQVSYNFLDYGQSTRSITKLTATGETVWTANFNYNLNAYGINRVKEVNNLAQLENGDIAFSEYNSINVDGIIYSSIIVKSLNKDTGLQNFDFGGDYIVQHYIYSSNPTYTHFAKNLDFLLPTGEGLLFNIKRITSNMFTVERDSLIRSGTSNDFKVSRLDGNDFETLDDFTILAVGYKTTPLPTKESFFKYDASGVLQWSKTGLGELHHILRVAENTYAVSGQIDGMACLYFIDGEANPIAPPLSEFMENDQISFLAKKESKSDFTLHPNPAKQYATLSVRCETAQNATIRISSSVGKVVSSQQHNLEKGQNSITLDLQEMPSGIYFVTLTCLDGVPRTQMLSVQSAK